MKKIFVAKIIMMPIFIRGQSKFENEHYKYWYYRDRLKYFVMPGDAPGQSIVAGARNMSIEEGLGCMTLKYPQPHTTMGYYIGVLATEYRLLIDNGQWVEANATLLDLKKENDALRKHIEAQ